MRKLYLSIDATQRCNRGCIHCFSMANAKGSDFTVMMAQQLVDSILREGYERIQVTITGGGEPLMNPWLPEIVETLFRGLGNRLSYLGIVTSGVLPEDGEEEDRFARLINLDFPKREKRILVTLSFNCYNPTFSRRLTHSLEMLHSARCRFIGFNVVFGYERMKETHERIIDALESLRRERGFKIRNYAVDWKDEFVKGMLASDIFLDQHWSFWKHQWLQDVAYTLNSLYYGWDKDGHCAKYLFRPVSLQKYGRGKKIGETPWEDQSASCFPWRDRLLGRRDKLHLNAKGEFFSGCDCEMHTHPKLGSVRDSLYQILERRKDFFSGFMERIIACGDNLPICELCERVNGID